MTGSLHRGSPWLFSEDMQKAAAPDRDVHLRTAIYLVCWEFFDRDIAAPPCPYCGSPDQVRGVPCSTVDRHFSQCAPLHKVDWRAEGVQTFSKGMLDGNLLAAICARCMFPIVSNAVMKQIYILPSCTRQYPSLSSLSLKGCQRQVAPRNSDIAR